MTISITTARQYILAQSSEIKHEKKRNKEEHRYYRKEKKIYHHLSSV